MNAANLLPLIVSSCTVASQGAPVALSASELHAENEHLERLGLDLRGRVLLRENPFVAPWSSRSFLVPSSWYRRRDGDEMISAQAMRDDLFFLEKAFDEAYGGWDRRVPGFDYSAWFGRWRTFLDEKETLPLREALAPLREFQAHRLDNHSGPLVSERFGGGSETYLLRAVPNGPCETISFESSRRVLSPSEPHLQPRRVRGLRGEVWLATYPSFWGKAHSLLCQGKEICLAPLSPEGTRASIERFSGADWNEPRVRELSPGVVYVRLPTFSLAVGEKLLALAKEPQPRAPRVLVVDLRQNDGGSGGYALPLLARWLPAAELSKKAAIDRNSKVSCLTRAFGWGYQQVMLAGTKGPLSPEILKDLQSQLDALFETRDCSVGWERVTASWHYADHRFEPTTTATRVVALVDRATASDGEWVTALLAAYPHTLVVGENTFGVGEFTQPLYFVLPQTRLPFRVARGRSDVFGDGRPFDGLGLPVDAFLAPTETTLENVLRLLEDASSAEKRG